jgi:hypothetical protein
VSTAPGKTRPELPATNARSAEGGNWEFSSAGAGYASIERFAACRISCANACPVGEVGSERWKVSEAFSPT